MTVIKINAITVPEGSGDELARRFAARVGAVDNQDGFEGFELLQPTDERTTWLVVTRWRDEDAFQAWVSSAGLRPRPRRRQRAARRTSSARSPWAPSCGRTPSPRRPSRSSLAATATRRVLT